MTESGVWAYLKKGMIGTGWHATRIESSSGNGVPDVSFGIPEKNGWMELKYIPEWPKREGTIIKLPLRPEQKHWIKARGYLSGDVWVFVRIKDTFFILTWEKAMEAYEGWTCQDWLRNATAFWEKRVDFGELCRLIKGGCPGEEIQNCPTRRTFH